MKKLNLKMQGIGEMLSKEQMKNVTGGYGCLTSLDQYCNADIPQLGGLVGGTCNTSPSGVCECKVGSYYVTPMYALQCSY